MGLAQNRWHRLQRCRELWAKRWPHIKKVHYGTKNARSKSKYPIGRGQSSSHSFAMLREPFSIQTQLGVHASIGSPVSTYSHMQPVYHMVLLYSRVIVVDSMPLLMRCFTCLAFIPCPTRGQCKDIRQDKGSKKRANLCFKHGEKWTLEHRDVCKMHNNGTHRFVNTETLQKVGLIGTEIDQGWEWRWQMDSIWSTDCVARMWGFGSLMIRFCW